MIKFKYFFDIFMVLSSAILVVPICILIALMVKIKLGSPIFFKQSRPGLNGRVFDILKFRTMTNELGTDGSLLSNKDRMTTFGKFLRSTSVDELPSLWNILKGDMSLVGPRPLLVEYLPLYSTQQARRHEIKPGVTGWSQVNGRNAISWEDKFELDVWYVDNQTFWLDLKILWLTVRKVIMRSGVNHSIDVAMPRFTGSYNEKN
jgi:lipopolysaccharide/colanic/teichoic acid biosynthesis glycosyltransferase